jgi:hypothetical protein
MPPTTMPVGMARASPYGSDILLKDSYLARRSCFDFVETRG